MRLETIVALSCFSLTLCAGVAADPSLPRATPWEKFDEADGIAVFRREVPGTALIALRGEGVVNAPIVRVASVLVDPKRGPEWIDSLAEARCVRRVSDTEYVEWDHVKTPFVLADRDFVFDVKFDVLKDKKQVLLAYHSVNDPAAPKTDYVRGVFPFGKFVLTPLDHGKKTRVLAEVLADPKGSVPKWIVNLFQKSWPHDTLVNLRSEMQRRDLKDDARVAEALKSGGLLD